MKWKKAKRLENSSFIPKDVVEGDFFLLELTGNYNVDKRKSTVVKLVKNDHSCAPLFKCMKTGGEFYVNWFRLKRLKGVHYRRE